MPLLETRGAASIQGFGAFDSAAPTYVDDVFSTYLYTGTGSTQTITNGIQLGDMYGDDPYFSANSLLLHFNGSNGSTTLTDSSNRSQTLTAVGAAAISTSQSKFGGSSLYLDGTTNCRVDVTPNASLAFGSGDFTFEFWIYPVVAPSAKCFFDTRSSAASTAGANFRNNGAQWYSVSTSILNSSITPQLNEWSHVAWVRSKGVLYVYVNGQLGGSVAFTTALTDTNMKIGMYVDNNTSFQANAYFDEIRLTPGVARYLAPFSVPTARFSDSTDPVTQGKGGMVWIKQRSAAENHKLVDTARGATLSLESNTTIGNATETAGLTAFTSSGFTLGADAEFNFNTGTYASWTFRKAPKFFDVVTYTGNGSNRTIAHNLGSVPGCIIVKRTDTTADWQVYHRSLSNTEYLVLNTTAAKATGTTRWNSTTATATDFSLGTDATVNANTGTYVAYLFAHDTATDGLIQCGSFTTDGSGNATVSLGWEPQFLIVKRSDGAGGSWITVDQMRGWVNSTAANTDNLLLANSSGAESAGNFGTPTATGFAFTDAATTASATFVYLAIRRPNKPPTSGTQVYNAIARTGTGAAATVTGVGFAPDFSLTKILTNAYGTQAFDRLRGQNRLQTQDTGAEFSDPQYPTFDAMDGFKLGTNALTNGSGASFINWFFRRAPGFFDVVCYTGTGSARTVDHGLGVVPEMIITKARTKTYAGRVYHLGMSNTEVLYFYYGPGDAKSTETTAWNSTTPTSTVFTVGTGLAVNESTTPYVAYLFATLPGISKVFSYTGNGTSQTINCGFSAGARFVLIKRTDSTGDWYVWDSTRGIVAANDPHLSLNTTAAEVTTDDSVDTDNSGFIVNQVTATNINVNNATYIGLAIA